MNLEKQVRIVSSIHDTLQDYIGEKLVIRANLGRSKIVEDEGVLLQVYPQLFVVEVHRKRGRVARQSYQFVDILTGTVELIKDEESLFGPFVEEEAGLDDYLSSVDYEGLID